MNTKIKPIYDLCLATGMNEKKRIIEENKDNHYFYYYMYFLLNPHYNYYVSDKVLAKAIKNKPVTDYGNTNEFTTWCQRLNSLPSMNNDTLNALAHWINDIKDVDEQQLMFALFTRTLRPGVGATTFNKVKKNWIPIWEVQQAYVYDNVDVPEDEEFWLTQKLNGVRATYYRGNFYSRNGSEYKGLQHITKELDAIANLHFGYVIDGELTLKREGEYEDINDNKAFRIATGIINSDAENKLEIQYTIFDIISLADFESDSPTDCYSKRREVMDYVSIWLLNSKNISVLPVLYHGNNQSEIYPLLTKMVNEDKEGLMMNRNVPYYKKRHNGLLKIKKFYTMDLPIVRLEHGTGRNKDTLGAICVDFKGNIVKVGSGFTDHEREWMWEHQDELIGKFAEVKYKEVSKNKANNLESLQFPVFVRIREDKDSPSYN